MSIVPGSTVIQDPNAELAYEWNWSDWLVGEAVIDESEFIVSEIAGDATPLVADDESVLEGDTSTRVLLSGGTVGKTYTVTNRVTTDEVPPQIDDRSIKVKIAAQ